MQHIYFLHRFLFAANKLNCRLATCQKTRDECPWIKFRDIVDLNVDNLRGHTSDSHIRGDPGEELPPELLEKSIFTYTDLFWLLKVLKRLVNARRHARRVNHDHWMRLQKDGEIEHRYKIQLKASFDYYVGHAYHRGEMLFQV